MTFGLSRTGIENYLRFGKRILIKFLSRDIKSKIGTPSRSRVETYKEAVKEKHPALEDVGLSMDGLRLSSETPGSFVGQNNYYNGWNSVTTPPTFILPFHILSINRCNTILTAHWLEYFPSTLQAH